jgi:hypothetical protein
MNSEIPKVQVFALGAACLLAFMASSHAAVITFDEVIAGETSYGYDGDADGINDVIFSTSDTNGFNTGGPGTNMNFITEPGIEGTTLLGTDLRVDFLFGASANIAFGFAMSTSQEIYGVTFELYDHADTLIESTYQVAAFTNVTVASDFPEAVLNLEFTGVAAYGLFKFDKPPERYIIDNLQGRFGSRPEEQDAVITSFVHAPEGVIIEWTPVFGLDSVVKCSPDLVLNPFDDLSAVLPYPQNSYTDTVHNADSKCFYRVDLVQ